MPFKHNASRRHRIPKAPRRVTNWPAYQAGLRRRGDLTFWLYEAALSGWRAPRRTTRGGQPLYADIAIELVLTLRLVFHLAQCIVAAEAQRTGSNSRPELWSVVELLSRADTQSYRAARDALAHVLGEDPGNAIAGAIELMEGRAPAFLADARKVHLGATACKSEWFYVPKTDPAK